MEPSLVWTGLGSMALVLAIPGHQYQVNNGLSAGWSPQIVTLVIIPSLAELRDTEEGGGQGASWPLSTELANL